MSQTFKLDIPKPCEKGKNDWNVSQKTEKGIFFSHCQTEVIDFLEKTPAEIKSFFKNYQNPVCGKFHPVQLTEYQISNQKPTWFSKILVGGLLSFLVLQKAEAQTTQVKGKVVIFHKNDKREIKVTSDSTENQTITIIGRVIRKNNKSGISGANIIIRGTTKGTTSDNNGNFTIVLKKNLYQGKWILLIAFVGLKSKEIEIDGDKKVIDLGNILLKKDNHTLGLIQKTDQSQHFGHKIFAIVRKWIG